MKKWQCTVCGYIHEGDEPPEECPVCGADRSKFIEIVSEEPVETKTDQPEPEDKKMDSSFDTRHSFVFYGISWFTSYFTFK